MAACSVQQEVHAKADDMRLDRQGVVGLFYDYVTDSPFLDEYARCIGTGYFDPQPNAMDGFDVTKAATDHVELVPETQNFKDLNNQKTGTIVYPWMKQRRRRNGDMFNIVNVVIIN